MKEAFRKTPLAIILVILSFIAPTELSLVVGDLRLSPHRVVFLIFLPFAIARLLTRPDCRPRRRVAAESGAQGVVGEIAAGDRIEGGDEGGEDDRDEDDAQGCAERFQVAG